MEPATPRDTSHRRRILIGVLLALVVVTGLVLMRYATHRVTQERLRQQLVATIQSEARASFLVTGSLDLTATTTIESAKTFLPGLLNIDLGTSTATAQVPGRAYYGFDVRQLDASHIDIRNDTVFMSVPQPQLLSVDANLQQMSIKSSKGWLRTPASVGAVERTAMMRIDNVLKHQAASYVASSVQPHVNSAHALKRMLVPVLKAAGIDHPVFQFRIGQQIVLDE